MKRNRFLTFIVVPESSKSIHWTIPSTILRVMTVLGVLLVLGCGFILYDYVVLTSQVSENKALRTENRQLLVQLQNLDNKLALITKRMDSITQFRSKIAEFTSLNDPDRSRTLAMGPLEMPEDELNREPGALNHHASEADVAQNWMHAASLLSNIDFKMRKLSVESRLEEQSIHKLYDIVQGNQSYLRSMPSLRPTLGWVTSTFGYRVSPYTGYKKLHDGIDIATSVGTKVVAPADGVVTFAGVKPGYGLVLVIDHGYGIETRYAHNSRFHVKPGEVIKRGQNIASTGNTGLSTGPHLHYEVRINGVPVDPSKYFLD